MKKIKQFFILCTKNQAVALLSGMVAFIILASLITFFVAYAKPLNSSDYEEVANSLKTDSTTVGNIQFSEIETYQGKDVQTIKWELIQNNDTLNKVSIIEVKKGFLKYKFNGVIQTY